MTPTHDIFDAAEKGYLDLFPVERMTPKNLQIRNAKGLTPLHVAAIHRTFHQIPAGVLPLELLLVKDLQIESVLITLAKNEIFGDLPLNIQMKLTPEQFSTSLLGALSDTGKIGDIPEHIREKTLTFEKLKQEHKYFCIARTSNSDTWTNLYKNIPYYTHLEWETLAKLISSGNGQTTGIPKCQEIYRKTQHANAKKMVTQKLAEKTKVNPTNKLQLKTC
jgi:hypothetical protein